MPVFGLGGIRTLAVAEKIVEEGRVDLVSLSRPFIRDPFLVKHFREGLTAEVRVHLLQQVLQPPRHPLRRAHEKALEAVTRYQAPRSRAAASMRMKKAWPSVAMPGFSKVGEPQTSRT